jgi:predicted transposase/invertase (TIGR01784 family)
MFHVSAQFIPCHDVVFSMMFENGDLFKQLIKAVTGNEIELIDTPYSQISKRENVPLSSVRFDLYANTTQGAFTVDMQRTLSEDFVNRVMFYACRLVSVQDVKRMKYSMLQPVNVSFIMSENSSDSKNYIRYVKALYTDTGETFSDVLNIALVFVPSVVINADTNSDIRVFAEFFSIKDNEDAKNFETTYKDNSLGEKLMREYTKIQYNEDALRAFAKDSYFTVKDLEEIQTQRDTKRIKQLATMHSLEDLAKIFELPLEQIKLMAEQF